MPESGYLFVYGTLRGAANTEWSRRLKSMARDIGAGRTRGQLFHVKSYPGMLVSAGDDDWVTGEVFQLTDPSRAWPMLDQYEGCGPADPPPHQYERQIVDVYLNGGETVRAWVYVYCLPTEGKKRILSGDFLRTA